MRMFSVNQTVANNSRSVSKVAAPIINIQCNLKSKFAMDASLKTKVFTKY